MNAKTKTIKPVSNLKFSEADIKSFQDLFAKYCLREIANKSCAEDTCEFCTINESWHRIFDELCPDAGLQEG